MLLLLTLAAVRAADPAPPPGTLDPPSDPPEPKLVPWSKLTPTRRVVPTWPAGVTDQQEYVCTMRFTVDTAGTVTDAVAKTCVEPFLDAARAALVQWTFHPVNGTDGAPIPVRADITVKFIRE